MYKIHHNIDGEKTTTLNDDNELIHFVRKIAVENEDHELSITSVGEAKDYLNNYCSNLTLTHYDLTKINFSSIVLKEHLDTIRNIIISQIRRLMKDKGVFDIDFTTPLVFLTTDEQGENEVLSGICLSGNELVPDTVFTTYFGDVAQELSTTDLQTNQLLWMLEQIETDAYELAEND